MGYPVAPLGSLTEKIDYGLTASATKLGNGPKFLRITDIQEQGVDWLNVPLCDCDEEEQKKYALEIGDIVFARTGATTGKSFLIRNCPTGAVFASYLIRVRPSEKIDPVYLSYFFQTPNYWHQISQSSTGTAQAGVNASNLKKLAVILPPIEEQRRIAAILDRADAIRRKRQEAIALTEELLRSTFLEMFDDPTTIQKSGKYTDQNLLELGFSVKPLDEVANVIDCKHRTPIYTEAGYPVIRPRDVREEGINFNNCLKTSFEEYNDLTEKRKPKNGDIVYSRNATFGVASFIETDQEFAIGQDVCLIVAHGLNPVFLYYLLNSYFVRKQLESAISGSTFKRINLSEIRKLKILVPGTSLQNSFVDFYHSQKKIIANLKRSMLEAENLFKSLLQQAFQGEL